MILDALFSLLTFLLDAIAAALPDMGSLPWAGEIEDVHNIITQFATRAGWANDFLPLTEIVSVIDIYITFVLPALLAFHVTSWIVAHLPVVGKG